MDETLQLRTLNLFRNAIADATNNIYTTENNILVPKNDKIADDFSYDLVKFISRIINKHYVPNVTF